MEKQSLTSLFEEKLNSIKEIESQKRKQVYEINLNYANSFFELVKKVLSEMNYLNTTEEIQPSNTIIGEFNSPNMKKKSVAILTKDGLEITLYFDSNPFLIPNREKEYDETIINTLLKGNGITVETLLPTLEDNETRIRITYIYEKEKNYTPTTYEETRELTIGEGREIISLINALKELDLLNEVTFGLPTEEISIYIFKTSNNHWTICSKLASYGLENPQFFDTSTKAIQEVFKRLKTDKNIVECYSNNLKSEESNDPENVCSIYGYSIQKTKRLNT